jgi:M6 family metalloprotease-like protein
LFQVFPLVVSRRTLPLFLAFLIVPCGALRAAEFVCAGTSPPTAKPLLQSSGTLNALVVFAKFQGEAAGQELAPPWAADLFDPELPGSFAHFYDEASRGRLLVRGSVAPKRYSSLHPASDYVADRAGVQGRFGQLNLEILEQVDPDVDLGLFDNDGVDGVPNSGDDDGYVDVVFINLLTVPQNFFISGATGFASLGLDTDFISDDAAAGGGRIKIRSRFSGFGGTTQRGHVFSVTASTMCHEFGHVLGLPDLFDQSSVALGDELNPEQDSAGIGKWGLMGLGTLGWGIEDGPNAFSAWSLARLGWVEVVEISSSRAGLVIDNIDAGGAVFKIPIGHDEYLLLENRQASDSYYNRNVPGTGLLVWHADDQADNDEERHKQVDLVCADGLYSDRGFPGALPDPRAGRDNLDFWSRDGAYALAHNGNQGDATDPFDGVERTRLAFDTNPPVSAHTGFTRDLPLGIVVENMRSQGSSLVADIVRQQLPGHVYKDTTWSGDLVVDGDLVIEPGASLRLAPGTTVRFATNDSRRTGFSPERCELIAYGALLLPASGESPARFLSAADQPGAADWQGIFLLNGQAFDEASAVLENAAFDLVWSHLPQGTTRWSGRRTIPMDLVIPSGAELVVGAGSRLGFSSTDLGGSGLFPELTELLVEGRLEVDATPTQPATFTLASGRRDSLWYGVHLKDGAELMASNLNADQGVVIIGGEVGVDRALVLMDSRLFTSAGYGLRLTINGVAEVTRTTITRHPLQGIHAEGSGTLLLRNSSIVENGQEGIFLGNCSLEAIDCRIEQNGLLDANDPRSGLLAVGGRGQRIELWNSTVASNPLHGLDLTQWQGRLELHSTEISANRRSGLQAAGLELLVFEDAAIERNLGAGAVVSGSPLEVWTTRFADNIGTGLVIGPGSTGLIEMGVFTNNSGIEMTDVDGVMVRSSRFENSALALSSVSSTPSLYGNRFTNNLTAVDVSGDAVPASVTRNSFLDNQLAIANRTALPLVATGNFWGTVDSTEIADQFSGQVDFAPFLDVEPDLTAVAEVRSAAPLSHALGAPFPNPFNARTVIPFAIGTSSAVTLEVFDILGRRVRTVEDRNLGRGRYSQVWDGRDDHGRQLGSGVYLIRLGAGQVRIARRAVLLR